MAAKLLPSAFLLLSVLLLSLGGEMISVVEGRQCEMNSGKFRHMCLSSATCTTVCETEGFTSGHCGSFPPKCICSKPCPAEEAESQSDDDQMID